MFWYCQCQKFLHTIFLIFLLLLVYFLCIFIIFIVICSASLAGHISRQNALFGCMHLYLSYSHAAISIDITVLIVDSLKLMLVITVLQDWQCKSENWDVERRSLQQQIDSLQTQNQILASKCDMIAETSTDLRSQLERRREKLEGTEQNLKAQVTQLSTLLERSKDTISSQVTTVLFSV